MAASDIERRYEHAVHRLTELVFWRNEYLLELETMCSLPLAIAPSSGSVAEFDARQGARLLDRIALQNVQIGRAMEEVNHYAAMLGRKQLEWKAMPKAVARRPSVLSEMPSA